MPLTILLAAVALGVSLGPAGKVVEAKIHLVVFCDTEDLKIGDGCKVDGDSIELIFRSNVVKKDLEIERFDGKKMSRAQIMTTLKGKKLGPNDTLVFYYSGHGGHDSKQGHFLQVGPTAKKSADRYLFRSVLLTTMKARGAGLNIIVTDCCNNPINVKSSKPSATSSIGTGTASKTSPAFHALFIKPRGLVDFTSSKRGEQSVGTDFGGIFTLELIDYLKKNAQRPVTWEAFARTVATKTYKRFKLTVPLGMKFRTPQGRTIIQRTQTPVCRIDLPGATSLAGGPKKGKLPPPSATGPRFGVRAARQGGRLVITQVVTGSPATRVKVAPSGIVTKLEKRDVILRINGKRISTVQQYNNAIDTSPRRMTMRVISHRNNKQYDLDVVLAR